MAKEQQSPRDIVLELVRGIVNDLDNVEGYLEVGETTGEYINFALRNLGCDEHDMRAGSLTYVLNKFVRKEYNAKAEAAIDMSFLRAGTLKALTQSMLENDEGLFCEDSFSLAEELACTVLECVPENEENKKIGIISKAEKLSNLRTTIIAPCLSSIEGQTLAND